MKFVGMFMLGAFIGWVISYALFHVPNWKNFGTIVTSIISAAVAGGVLAFIKVIGLDIVGEGIFMYPVGLAYGALCNGVGFVGLTGPLTIFKTLLILAIVVATILVLALFLSPEFRARLP